MGREVMYPAPRDILQEEFLLPMSITAYRLAKDIGVQQRRIGELIAGKRAITVDKKDFHHTAGPKWFGIRPKAYYNSSANIRTLLVAAW